MSKVSRFFKSAKNLDRSLTRKLRKAAVESILELSKEASSTNEQHGIFQNMQSGVTEYSSRKDVASSRGGEAPSQNYGVNPPHQKSKVKYTEAPRTLSTRYSPDRPGVQAPTKGGIQIDPLTGKKYDWNEGFSTETGESFPGGNVSLQSDIHFEY